MTTELEAIQNPGSNIEYTITVSEKWVAKVHTSNGQYLVNTDRKDLKLIVHGTIIDPVIMLKIRVAGR